MPQPQSISRLIQDPGYRARWTEQQLTLPVQDRDLITIQQGSIIDTSFAGWIFPREVTFDRVIFGGRVNFTNCVFHGRASFDRAHFQQSAPFDHSIFHDDAIFSNARFDQDAQFNAAIAHKSLTFSGSAITGLLSFTKAHIHEHLTLDGVHSGYRSDLTDIVIDGGVTFRGDGDVPQLLLDGARISGRVIFPRRVHSNGRFVKASFSDEIELGEFHSDVFFEGASFGKQVRFNQPVHGKANFKSTRFKAGIIFKASLDGEATFKGAIFDGPAIFPKEIRASLDLTDAVFAARVSLKSRVHEKCDLTHATFKGPADFSYAEFNDDAIFRLALFLDRSSFVAAKFRGSTDFRETHFRQAPDFHDSDWASPARFSVGATFRNSFPDTVSDHAESSYVTLKRLARKSEAHSEERQFFALEARSRAHREGLSARFLAWLYGILSDYGQSIARPLAFLGTLSVLSFKFAYLPIFQTATTCIERDSTLTAVLFGARQSLPILYPFTSSFEKAIDCYFPAAAGGTPPLLSVIGGVHAFFALALIFLIGLAIRNRFRLQ